MNKSKNSNFSLLVEKIQKRKSDLTKVNLPSLDDLIEKSILNFSHELSGEFDFYCVYEKQLEQGFSRYALIYAFYPEDTPFHKNNLINESSIEKLANDDAWKLFHHFQMLNIPLDYLFVVPYYDKATFPKGSTMYPATITSLTA